MKAKALALFIALLVAGAAMSYDRLHDPGNLTQTGNETSSPPAAAPERVPDFSFKTLEGKTYSIRALREPRILLHFWASWCASCLVEFPKLLERVDRENGAVALVAVSIDDDKDAMLKLLSRLRTQSKTEQPHVYWVWDGDKSISLRRFNVISVPETVVIDPARLMNAKIVGETDWTRENLLFSSAAP